MKDLIVAVADSYQEKVLEALLPRIPMCSHTRRFSFEIIRNILKDSGSYNESHELLRPSINAFSYSIVIFDYEGSGIENTKSRVEAESEVERLLSINGWNNRNAVVIIEPEIENWMWIDNQHVEAAIGWDANNSLYDWARNEGWLIGNSSKPTRPKESIEKALKVSGTSKSSSIYKKIASNVSYRRCQDPSFLKLLDTLKIWFPIP